MKVEIEATATIEQCESTCLNQLTAVEVEIHEMFLQMQPNAYLKA